MTLRFLVRYQTLTMLETGMEPRQGSANYLKLLFNFASPDWKSLRKTLYISSGKYSEPFILESSEFEVPTYYTQQGSFTITLLGDASDVLVPTNELEVTLSESNNLWTASPPDPENSAYVQLINSLGSLSDLQTDDKSTVVAAINEILWKGTGTSGFPEPSEQDEGAFLRVVGGVPVWSTLPVYNGEVEDV